MKKALCTTAIAALMLAACQPYFDPKPALDAGTAKAEDAAKAQRDMINQKPVIYTGAPFLGVTKKVPKVRYGLPPELATAEFTLRREAPMSITQIAAKITEKTGVPVKVDPQAANPIASGASGIAQAIAGGLMTPNHSDTFESFLSQVAAVFDIEPGYEGDTIYFTKYRTEIITVNLPTNKTITEARVGAATQGNGGTQVTASSQNLSSRTQTVDFWKDLEQALKRIVPQGTEFQTNPSMRNVVVRGAPSARRDVRAYLEQIDKTMSRRVAVDLSVIFIDVSDNDTFGLSVDALYRSSLNGMKLGFTNMLPTLSSQSGTGSIGILEPAPGSNTLNNHFAGTDLFIRAVAESRRLADIKNGSVIATNHSPTPINLTTDEDVISRTGLGSTANSLLATAETKTINYGLSLIVDPIVNDERNIHLFLSMNNSEKTAQEDRNIGNDQLLTLTTIDRRDFNTDVVLRSGETAVLAGFEMQTSRKNDMGVGRPWFKALGGSREAEVRKTRLLIIATAHLLPDDRTASR